MMVTLRLAKLAPCKQAETLGGKQTPGQQQVQKQGQRQGATNQSRKTGRQHKEGQYRRKNSVQFSQGTVEWERAVNVPL